MRVFVTGGAGFIGSNCVQALLSAGHSVAVVDDLSTGSPGNVDPRCEFRQLDIVDPECATFLAGFGPDVVIHLAAQASVTASIADPDRDREVNALGTQLMAVAARDAGAARMLSASSAAVYGDPSELPLRETSPTRPINPYGESKLEAERLLAEVLSCSGTDFASLRFSNVYGPRQDAEGEGGVVAIFLGRISKNETPVVFGDGNQTRDFVFVGDVVSALLTAATHPGPLASEAGSAYNVSTGRQTSVNELMGSLRMATGYLGPIESQPARKGDIADSVLDPARAASTFGWRAGVGIDSGLAVTWRWFSQHA